MKKFVKFEFSIYGLDSRRDVITQKMFQEIKDPKHPLHYLLSLIHISEPTRPY